MIHQNQSPALRSQTKSSRRKDSGQGMTEYIIIVALIAIAAIGVVTIFGQDVRIIFGGATNALAGDTNVTVNGVKPSTSQTSQAKTLKTFGKQQ